jgi:hypothetical protein
MTVKNKLNLMMLLFLLLYIIVGWRVGEREAHLYVPHPFKQAQGPGKVGARR